MPLSPEKSARLGNQIDSYQALLRKGAPTKPSKPNVSMPRIEDMYRKAGEQTGQCPYELKDILYAALTSDNEIVVSALQDLITATKLSLELPAVQVTRRNIEEIRLRGERAIKQWEEQCREVEKETAERAEIMKSMEAEISSLWMDMVIDVGNRLARHPDVDKLPEKDQRLIRSLSANGYATIHHKRDKKTASVNLNACRKATITSIVNFYKAVEREELEEIEEKRHAYMMAKMWKKSAWGQDSLDGWQTADEVDRLMQLIRPWQK